MPAIDGMRQKEIRLRRAVGPTNDKKLGRFRPIKCAEARVEGREHRWLGRTVKGVLVADARALDPAKMRLPLHRARPGRHVLNLSHVPVMHADQLAIVPSDRDHTPTRFRDSAAISGISSPINASALCRTLGFGACHSVRSVGRGRTHRTASGLSSSFLPSCFAAKAAALPRSRVPAHFDYFESGRFRSL
jgi:hypothetical protein